MNGSVYNQTAGGKKRQTNDEEEDNSNWQPASGQDDRHWHVMIWQDMR